MTLETSAAERAGLERATLKKPAKAKIVNKTGGRLTGTDEKSRV